jgi:tetratricopeptide (TPR) repeat protein
VSQAVNSDTLVLQRRAHRHWENAGDALEAARWHRRAALRTAKTNVAEAARHWQRVKVLAAELPDSAETLQLALQAGQQLLDAAWRTGVPNAEADALFADARALAERKGELRSLAMLLAYYGAIKQNQGDVPSFIAHVFESVRVAEQTGDPVLIGSMHDQVIFGRALFGQLAAAEEGYRRAVALLGGDPTAGIEYWGMSSLLSVTSNWVYALAWMGRFREAEVELRRACEVGRQYQQLEVLSWMEGRDRRAWLIGEPWLLVSLAESHLGTGDAAVARALAEEALALAQQRKTPIPEIDAQLVAVRVRRCAEGLSARSAIEAGLERALVLVTETGARGFEPHVYLERAELARLAGDEESSQKEFREAHRLFTEMGATIRAAEVAKELGL